MHGEGTFPPDRLPTGEEIRTSPPEQVDRELALQLGLTGNFSSDLNACGAAEARLGDTVLRLLYGETLLTELIREHLDSQNTSGHIGRQVPGEFELITAPAAFRARALLLTLLSGAQRGTWAWRRNALTRLSSANPGKYG